MLLLL
jgi:Fe-S cluster biogenesis protein NfuA